MEAAVAYGPVKFQGEYINVNYSGTTFSTTPAQSGIPYSRDINSGYVSALWMITGERYAEAYRNGVFGRIVPISNFEPGGSGTGAWELGLRYSVLDATDFTRTNPPGSGQQTNFSPPSTLDGIPYASVTTNKVTSATIGLKWIWNPNFRLMLNYVRTMYDTPITVVQGGYQVAGGVPTATINKEDTIMMRAAWDW
jgi:phosphate-selective porin OprO/OprP